MRTQSRERGLTDTGDVQERIRGPEGAVEIAVIDEAAGERWADAGQLRELDGSSRVQIDGEPERDSGGGIVVDQAAMEPTGTHVPDRHPHQAAGQGNGDHRLNTPGELVREESLGVG